MTPYSRLTQLQSSASPFSGGQKYNGCSHEDLPQQILLKLISDLVLFILVGGYSA